MTGIDKREQRRLRAEEAQSARERGEKRRVVRGRLLVAVAVLAVAAFLYAATHRGEQAGRVWSPEHGHWHDQ